jgi:hydroxyquinol 1,2-dioxygenase
MRGVFKSDSTGGFVVRTVLPVPYSIPMDGPVGEIMVRTKISPMRPSHIHFLINAPGHHQLITHLFKKSCPYIARRGLRREGPVDLGVHSGAGWQRYAEWSHHHYPFWMLEYDFVLEPIAEAA